MADRDAAPSPLLKIHQFAPDLGLRVHTIRYDEQRGLLPAAWDDPWTGYRSDMLDQFDRLQTQAAGRAVGCRHGTSSRVVILDSHGVAHGMRMPGNT